MWNPMKKRNVEAQTNREVLGHNAARLNAYAQRQQERRSANKQNIERLFVVEQAMQNWR